MTRVEQAILRVAQRIMRHWLLVANLALFVFASLPVAAPVLMLRGQTALADPIYAVYRLTCHQEPHRSYFLGGPRLLYSKEDIEAVTDVRPLARFIGNAKMGYKMAYCQRDVATYGALLTCGLIYPLLRRRLPRLPLWMYGALLVPLAIDGGTQLLGLRESTWLLRTLTGALFGVATAWLLYPEVDAAMRKTAEELAARMDAAASSTTTMPSSR